MPVALSERSPLSSLPSHSNSQYGRGSRQAAAAFDEEKSGGDNLSGGGKGPSAFAAAAAGTGAGLGKDRRTAVGEAGDASQQSAEADVDADSQQDLLDDAGVLMMQVDDGSAPLSAPGLTSHVGVLGVLSHKRKKKGAVGQKRAAIVGAAAASAAAKAERKAGGPQDGVVEAPITTTAAAPRGGNVQPGQGGTRKRKQKEVDPPTSTPTHSTQHTSRTTRPAPALHPVLSPAHLPVLARLLVSRVRRRLWWSQWTRSQCYPSV